MILPTWVIQNGVPYSELSHGFVEREPLQIARPANPPPPQEHSEHVPESAESSDIEDLGTSKNYKLNFSSNPGGCSPKTRLSPRANTTQTPVAGPSMSPSGAYCSHVSAHTYSEYSFNSNACTPTS